MADGFLPGRRFRPRLQREYSLSKVSAVASGGLGERKLVTIIFADLVGSTALGDEQDPERTRQLLERFYDAVTEELERAGGTVEKFAGDAVMAVFGSPVAHEDHAERALHAALAMRARLAAEFDAELALRIGVNSGEVVVGAARAGSSFVSGDVVNVAARLEQNAAAGQILVGVRTATAVRGAYELGPPFPLGVKGKREPVVAQELLREVARTRLRGLGLLRSTFVGRDAEVEQMTAAWSRVVETGEQQLLTVIGEAGVGKTALVEYVLARFAGQSPAPVILSGRCLAYGQGSSYWALAEVLRDHLGLPRTAAADEVVEHLRGREILGLTFGLDVAAGLHPLAARERLHDAWVALLEEMAAGSPTVVLVEDLHWAEDPLLDLLEELAREVQAPLMLLATARPEFADTRPAWAGRPHTSAVWLEPLSLADAGSMVRRLLGAETPPELEELIVERAEGNPFFVEELLASLIDQGLLRDTGRGWMLEETDGLVIPDSVRAVVAARIDLLGPEEKAALQAASVAGRVFTSAAVVDLLNGVEPAFAVLEGRGFIHRFSHGSTVEREYAFKHALTREVAYASLSKRLRARLHAAFADRLERIGEGGDQFATLLAHHYFEAVRFDSADLAWGEEPQTLARLTGRAIEWLERAGELAAGRFALDDGLALLERTLELDPPPETQSRIWRTIGRVHALRYSGIAAVEAYQRAVELSTEPGVKGELYGELALEAVQRYAMFNPMPTRELIDSWIDRALELAVPGTAGRAKALTARAIWSPAAEDSAAEAVEIAERLEDPELRSYAYNGRACAAFVARRYDESRDWAERRLALADDITDPDHVVDIFSGVIPGLLGRGRFDEARHYVQLHDDAASRLSTHHRVHAVAMKLELEELAGRWDRMRDLEGRVRETVEENVDTPCSRNARSLLACAVAGAYVDPESRTRELEERAAELEMDGYGGTLAPLRIRLALARDELAVLERLIEDAVPPPPAKNWWTLNTESARLDALAALRDRSTLESEAPVFAIVGTYLEPFALRALGVVREDEPLIDRAVRCFDAMGLSWHAEQTRAIVGRPARLATS